MFGGRLGGWEILIILVIILIVFGVGKLPQVGGAIGKGIREFRKGKLGDDEVVTKDDNDIIPSDKVKSRREESQ